MIQEVWLFKVTKLDKKEKLKKSSSRTFNEIQIKSDRD